MRIERIVLAIAGVMLFGAAAYFGTSATLPPTGDNAPLVYTSPTPTPCTTSGAPQPGLPGETRCKGGAR